MRSAFSYALRGGIPSLRLHVRQFIRHEVNRREAEAAKEALSSVTRRAELLRPEQPLLSVVIVVAEDGGRLTGAVDALATQTLKDFEVLAVESVSTSASMVGREVLCTPQVTLLASSERPPATDPRDFGIARARGRYLCCLSDQERLAPTYLEKAVYLLETQGYDVVSSVGVAAGGIEVERPQRYPVLADMLQRNHVSSCAVFRRDLWVDAGAQMQGGNEPGIMDDKWRFWMRVSALGARIVNLLDEPMILVERERSFANGDGSRAATAERRRFAIESNRDVLGERAMQLSERRRALALRVDLPLINLERGFRSDAETILIGFPFLILGGAERLLSGLAVHLARRGFRLIVVTTDPVYRELGEAAAWFEVATAEIYQLPRFLERGRWPEFIHYLFATRRIDLLWLVGSRLFYELLPELRAAHAHLRVLDLLFNTVGHTASNRQFAPYIDRTLVESREVAEWLFAAGETCDRVRQIESGVDCDVYRPRPRTPEMLQRLGVAPDAFVIGYSGRLADEKDPDAFLEIANLCRAESQLTFVMTGTGPLAEQVERRARSLDLGDRFRFLGAVADVRDAMAAYDVLVLPSRLDGRPQAVLESLALGVPVVASRVGGLPEIVQEGRTGFLCGPRDVQDFAKRILWLAAHREEHRRMQAAARDYAVSHLSARRMYEEYEEEIRNVLSR